ncbi:MAG: hypothetical protein GC159_17810 [Phycisphaera sp.]|nr:hypothetical protein [Phycisphaera sp.]
MRMCDRWLTGMCLVMAATTVAMAAPPKGFEQVDTEVTIGVQPGLMKYDKAEFTVAPGARVKLTLTNTDVMQHNLLICKPGEGVTMEVAKLAWALGADGMARHFIPDSPLVLHATKLLDPNASESIYFVAPKDPGGYPYVCTMPGHAFTMNGVMHVHQAGKSGGGSAGPGGLADVKYRYYEGDWNALPDFDKLTPVASGTNAANEFDIKPRKRDDQFGFAFDATLRVPVDGKYTFYLNSDDGSQLSIDGKMVNDFNGLHAPGEHAGAADLTKGDHAIRVIYFEKSGGEELHVAWSGPGFERSKLSPDYPTGGGSSGLNEAFTVLVTDRPMLRRVLMPNTSPRSVAVGLPGGINCVFDTEIGCVRYGWWGRFINTGPESGNGTGRGGQTCTILGDRFSVGDNGYPLRVGDASATPIVAFRGYRPGKTAPQFLMSIDGTDYTQTIDVAVGRIGLTYTFEFAKAPSGPVTFSVNPAGLDLSSSAGKWDGGTLTVPAAQARTFSVTLAQSASK